MIRGRNVTLPELCQGRRESKIEGLGRQDTSCVATSSGDGAGYEQEP
jgi:hypothetical protein